VSLLQATLEEEEDTDEKLSKLAETPINQKAEAAE
jgi:ferritin-like metal-binding protein YciE